MLILSLKILKLILECREELSRVYRAGLIDPKEIHDNLSVLFGNFTRTFVFIFKEIFGKWWHVCQTLNCGREVACVAKVHKTSHLS